MEIHRRRGPHHRRNLADGFVKDVILSERSESKDLPGELGAKVPRLALLARDDTLFPKIIPERNPEIPTGDIFYGSTA